MKLTRRQFSTLCGSAALAATVTKAWPSAFEDVQPLTEKSLTEVAAMIRAKSVTSTQLVQALLARIEVLNPKVNAYITVMAKQALAQAAELDAEQKTGKFRGPLHGIPIALKDNIDTAGTRTTAASPMFKDRIPTEDATIVTKLKKSGAIILGKLNLHEFAIGCTGDTLLVARLQAQVRRYARTCASALSARTPEAASVCLQRGAASWGSSRRWAWYRSAASFRAALISTTADQWPAPWKTLRSCSAR
jgi:hypothetical protein